jgi:hypothetical protein
MTRCSAPEAKQFDFWIGEWDCTWEEDGRGSNSIRPAFDGCVIEEQFDGSPALDFRGMSVSVYCPALGRWQQTWVDTEGNYFDLTGGMADGNMILACDDTRTPGRLRMVFSNIEADSLDWRWERSEDGERTWKCLWAIRYRRKNGTAVS